MSRPPSTAPRQHPDDDLEPEFDPLLRLLARRLVDNYLAEVAAARAGDAEKTSASDRPLAPPAERPE